VAPGPETRRRGRSSGEAPASQYGGVSTLGTPESLQDLIDRSAELEGRGARIQRDTDSGMTPDELAGFTEDYQRWIATAITNLPADLIDRFRAEYEGNFFSIKIKRFLEDPLDVSIFHKSDTPAPAGFSYWTTPFATAFRGPLLTQRLILIEAQQRATQTAPNSTIQILELICRRFPRFIYPLTYRQRNRPPFDISDEYDAQDLMHALLRIFFEDVRTEERVPSQAGASSQMDFLLKSEHTVVEVKMTRQGLGAKEIGEQLIVDIERYRAHPDCAVLVAFVYDPSRRLGNPAALEGDLSGQREGIAVAVYVVQG
jgi:REase_DpnII-MboI